MMSPNNPFPPQPKSSLSKEEVVAFLVDLQTKGWTVHGDGDHFVIIKNDVGRLRISPIQGGFRIEHETTVGRRLVGSSAFNLIQFKVALSQYLPTQSPARTRTVEQEPASNFFRISRLIGSARVEAAYDPYLDDQGLANLLTLVGLANSVSSDLCLMTSKKGAKRLTLPYVTAFFKELGCTSGEIRKTSSQNPHRRFMLLSGGQSLIMGMSLNDLDKNEAVHVESDAHDRPFFESEWAAGQPVWYAVLELVPPNNGLESDGVCESINHGAEVGNPAHTRGEPHRILSLARCVSCTSRFIRWDNFLPKYIFEAPQGISEALLRADPTSCTNPL